MSHNPASSPRRASSPAQGSTGAGVLKKIANAIAVVLIALVIAAIAIFWFIGDHTDFGRDRVVWKVQACGVGLVLVAGLLIACAFAYLGVRRAKRDVDIERYNQRSFGIVVLCVTALFVGFQSISRGLPAFRDLKEGTTTVTVTSCSFEQMPRSNPGTRADRTPDNGWDNTFTMTLADGTKRATVIETATGEDIASRGGLTGVLYEACASRSGSASMTVEVYPHTWSIVEARIN
ncbi:hypothetical protein [Schaalia odontolytica]|uniref:hypothetical protein n=1 Tax=Schaalia odontolytica TaxID=1660 RepID=UPI002109D667|nr:hypothetical protein [Schaalia odontolytica]MCQ5271623.1 hypothetical protein [Schaalia odontolytica]MCQ5280926.1 hypothetical protein [Schaalia odontolytica]